MIMVDQQKAVETRMHFSRMQTTCLLNSMSYIKLEEMKIFYLDLEVTLTLICDLDLINDL